MKASPVKARLKVVSVEAATTSANDGKVAAGGDGYGCNGGGGGPLLTGVLPETQILKLGWIECELAEGAALDAPRVGGAVPGVRCHHVAPKRKKMD